jgi:hypothetical protein
MKLQVFKIEAGREYYVSDRCGGSMTLRIVGRITHPEDLLNLGPGSCIRTDDVQSIRFLPPLEWPAEFLEGG